jgi:hypothetical protein
MKSTRYIISAIICCGTAGLALTGCGGSRSTTQEALAGGQPGAGAIVASVDGSVIKESTLNHWTAVQAAAQYETSPKAPLPAGVIPDPPEFRACISYLRRVAQREGSTKLQTNADTLVECEKSYRRTRAHALEILISFKWLEEEASRVGLKVTDAKLVAELARVRKAEFPSVSQYQLYLQRAHLTLADEYQRLRINLLSTGLQRHFQGEGLVALARFAHEFPRTWAARTSCRSADVNPNCKEYKGSIPPESRI